MQHFEMVCRVLALLSGLVVAEREPEHTNYNTGSVVLQQRQKAPDIAIPGSVGKFWSLLQKSMRTAVSTIDIQETSQQPKAARPFDEVYSKATPSQSMVVEKASIGYDGSTNVSELHAYNPGTVIQPGDDQNVYTSRLLDFGVTVYVPPSANQRWTYGVEIPTLTIIVLSVIGYGVGLKDRLQDVPRSLMAYAACAIYVSLSIIIDLSIAVQKANEEEVFEFDPICAVLLVETVKLFISTLLYFFGSRSDSATARQIDRETAWLFLPAFLFTLNNILVWWAIGENDASTFGVFRDTMILWTAILWRMVFPAQLGYIRLLGILIVFLGLILNRVMRDTSAEANGSFEWIGVMMVLAMTACNAIGSVSNEFAMKRQYGLDINLQNMILYSACVCFTFSLLVIKGSVNKLPHMFDGFTHHTLFTVCLQATTGLMISRILKYADSVQKNVAACLRGPSLVIIAPLFLKSHHDWYTLASALVVASGCLTYLSQGPLAWTPPKSDALQAPEPTTTASSMSPMPAGSEDKK